MSAIATHFPKTEATKGTTALVGVNVPNLREDPGGPTTIGDEEMARNMEPIVGSLVVLAEKLEGAGFLQTLVVKILVRGFEDMIRGVVGGDREEPLGRRQLLPSLVRNSSGARAVVVAENAPHGSSSLWKEGDAPVARHRHRHGTTTSAPATNPSPISILMHTSTTTLGLSEKSTGAALGAAENSPAMHRRAPTCPTPTPPVSTI